MRVGVLTVSDRSARGEREDQSGPLLVQIMTQNGWTIAKTGIVPDEQKMIESTLIDWADSDIMDLIVTTGGTGFSQRDCTPEATIAVVDRMAPGLAEAMRAFSLKITPHAMLSRAMAGIRGKVLIVNLPGSPRGAKENLEVILPAMPHAIELIRGDPGAEQGHLPHAKQLNI